MVPDTLRLAEMMVIDYHWLRPDPVVQDIKTGKVASDHPHIWQLTHLGVAAALEGKGLPFIDQVSRIIWDGSVDGRNEGDHLKNAATRTDVDLGELEAPITANRAKYNALVEKKHAVLQAAGHWGVLSMVFKGAPFFGQDRIRHVLLRPTG